MSTFAASSTSETKRGIFILFEGVDRCGKTTQSQLLAQKLGDNSNDTKTELIRFPDRTTTIGQIIDSYLKSKSELNDHSIHLLFSANRWEAKKSIEEKLHAGIHLVCDRYAYSGVAFTSAKEGMDLNWCKSCDSGLPSPDCIIYLDILPEEASQRGQFGEERYERLEFQKKVREQFMKLKEEDSQAAKPIPWFVLDAKKSIEELHQEIVTIAKQVEQSNQLKPIDHLWV